MLDRSYLWAISSRYQRKIISGVTNASELAQPTPTDDPSFGGQASPLIAALE